MVGFGFGTCGQAERQESASMQKMVEKQRLYIAVTVIIPLRGSKSSVAALALILHYIKPVAVLHQVSAQCQRRASHVAFSRCRSDGARYAIFQLGKGKIGDRQLVSEANLNLNHSPQVPMPGGAPSKEIGPRSYAMGWVISSYRGHPPWWHNGGIDGFHALLSLLPDQNLGVVILTNLLDDDPVPEIVQYHIYDHLLGLDSVDWAKHFQELDAKQKADEEEDNKKELSERKPNTHPSHDLKDYAGRYENPGYWCYHDPAIGRWL